MRRTLFALLAVLAALAAGPAITSAVAATSPPVSDCNSHGKLTGHYSVTELRTALATMPADVQEYTNCYQVIQHQMLAQIPGSHVKASDSSGSGSSFLPTPVLIVLIVLVLGGAAAGGLAIQRRNRRP